MSSSRSPLRSLNPGWRGALILAVALAALLLAWIWLGATGVLELRGTALGIAIYLPMVCLTVAGLICLVLTKVRWIGMGLLGGALLAFVADTLMVFTFGGSSIY